ncbi:LEAF RUST 10 DISEASE-RESISTANCE LOCUS RECEPTOR-LIKE PROTEIN KINASE-like 2.1 isoform X2 [Vigna angularis]|uniref:LEAF RUST 10 DISEASE-RESISTANCE LOCUS RECEPTOR-LIKE PROTEIN KINASE-like 2.1 isoform X2 n=1 Tax=Phaseolus angularis TaxID=3914 RepID=UPI000809BBD3|nr:LEAF RUST 10 DISEASE-RESISTANCE LOCUS RECEPTOR-LIKE PROTEIN KINASE-like 2.1 isoform X2 [Vigna angularis]
MPLSLVPLSLVPLSSSLINTLFFFSLLFPTYASSDAEQYAACEPFSCGKFNNISYPFWSKDQPGYCGHPKFKLDCQQDNATIDIMSQTFQVIDMNKKSNKVLTIARLDLLADPCTKDYVNVKLDPEFFIYTSNDDEYTLLYDCGSLGYTSGSVNFGGAIAFNCPIGGQDAFFVKNTEGVNLISLGCKNSINVSVLREAVKNDSVVGNVLARGFEVGWSGVNEDECDGCTKTSGRCGYNSSTSGFICLCPNHQSDAEICKQIIARSPESPHAPRLVNWKAKIVIGTTSAATAVFMLCLIIIGCRKCMSSRRKLNFQMTNEQDIEVFLKDHGTLAQKKYRFSEVKKMTNNFTVKLGEGGFGVVYKGELSNGYHVAVKLLRASKGNGKDFINEVASISRTSHVNVVQLLGFCLEGKKKALIYEFMPNGSLDKFISNKGLERTSSLTWDNLLQIAKGIAKGLEYLHKGCNTRILHFDIKPHNILLDENFCPKISDFGLAKLCPGKESTISVSYARGTIGYVAPEVCNKHFGGVSQKSDVYSYGMMLLEIVGVRNNINVEATETSEYFPDWIYRKLEQDQDLKSDDVTATKEKETERRMIAVSLWCIQTFPKDRPTMSRVIEMLEGNMNSQEIPPKPVLSSPTIGLVPELTTSSLQSE